MWRVNFPPKTRAVLNTSALHVNIVIFAKRILVVKPRNVFNKVIPMSARLPRLNTPLLLVSPATLMASNMTSMLSLWKKLTMRDTSVLISTEASCMISTTNLSPTRTTEWLCGHMNAGGGILKCESRRDILLCLPGSARPDVFLNTTKG